MSVHCVTLIMIPVLKDVLRWPLDARRIPARRRAPLLVGCSGAQGHPKGAVVASFYPLAWAAEHVLPPSEHVVDLTPPGVEPHDVELAPSDVETIQDAKLVVYLGGGFQPAVEDAVGARDGPSVDLLEGGDDPHIWLDPVRFARGAPPART